MDANQSVQDGREGEAEDVVEDGEGGGVLLEGGRMGSVVVEGGRAGVFDGAVVGGGDGAVALARHNDPAGGWKQDSTCAADERSY